MAAVLMVGPFPPPVHGFAEITRALAEHLEARPGGGVVRIGTAPQGAAGLLYHPSRGLRHLRAGWAILRARARGIGVLSLGCNAGWGMVYTLGLAGLARLTGLPVALHHHSHTYLDRRSGLMAALCRLGGPRLTHVCLSDGMRDRLRAVYGRDLAAAVLPNALFVPRGGAKPPAPVPGGRPVAIGLLSNLSAEKGLHDFIAAARALRAAAPDRLRLVLAGPIAEACDRARVEAAVAEGLLDWSGPLYGADKAAFFDRLDLFLFPTRYRHEAQPTVIYEALASGVPVFAFDRGSIPDQVRDCLSVVPAGTDFAAAAVAALGPLLALDATGWEALRARARARHAADIARGRATVAALFGAGGGPDGTDSPA